MYLNCHSYYSLRYGTLSVDALSDLALKHNIKTLALTDINNSTGTVDFVKACRKKRIKPVAGIDFRRGDQHVFTGIAKNNEGFRELNEFLSHHNINKMPVSSIPTGLEHCHIIYPFAGRPSKSLNKNEWIGLSLSDLGKIFSSEFRYDQRKLVLQQALSFENKSEFEIHKNLRAIDHNTLISKLEPGQHAHPGDYMRPPEEMYEICKNQPLIIKNSEKILDECSIDFDYQSIKNKKTFTGSRYDDKILLEKLGQDGLRYRYGQGNKKATERLKKEIEIIHKLGFSAYFLITWDIIRYSMSRGFHHVGRGSGANSILAYCLKITDVDPIELDLYFERFINPKRTSPPDFDIDYSWKERDEVLDYIFKRYGHRHTALLGTMTTFKGRSIIRELGKVYGLPKEEIDQLVDDPENEMHRNHITQKIIEIGRKIQDFPNLRSIHAGGILVSEEPITAYTALDMPPKGMQTTQWDMYVAEDIGFEKLDILSQRGIGHIHDAVEIIRENREISVDIHQVNRFKKDPKVKAQLMKGETNGCFYIESPAMRGLLKKLHCDNYISLVAASSIIRPGVAKSGMMREYIKRFHHPKSFRYLHPVMEEQLKETYGVMVYQEDVLKICHHFAGLDLADADVLRRAMSGKYRSKNEFKRITAKFFSNCKARGYPESLSREVWRQIESFAGYSFSKAHSASYAVESFQSLFLKTYFPREFMLAVINNFGGFYKTWVYLNEARKHGAEIQLPCVNNSEYLSCIRGRTIYLGFIHLANLEQKTAQAIVKERQNNGAYIDLTDFIRRLPCGHEQMILLIRTDAFRFTGKNKAEQLWQLHMLLGKKKVTPRQRALFSPPQKNFRMPVLEENRIEDAYDEIELLGFPVSMNYFDLLQTKYRSPVKAANLLSYVGQTVKMIGQLVTIKYVRTIKNEWMHFACFLDSEGDFFDSIHFPKSIKNYPFKGYGVYLILGKVSSEFDFPSIEVEKMAKLPIIADPRR